MGTGHRAAVVLVIEDDVDIRLLLRRILQREGYAVKEAASGEDGLRIIHQSRADAVILDIGLPDLVGWDVLERMRDLSDVPVLVLTAHSTEAEKVRGLNAGADDYLTKPFNHVELLARLHALLRRARGNPTMQDSFDDGRIRVDHVRRQAYCNGSPVPLTRTEYRLLCALIHHSGQVLSADQLVNLAWDEASELGAGRVKYAVLRLRRKLGWDGPGSPLQTVRGFGYIYEPPA